MGLTELRFGSSGAAGGRCLFAQLLPPSPRPLRQEIQTEPVLNALRDTRKNRRCKTSLPSAHLPITAHQEYSKSESTHVGAFCFLCIFGQHARKASLDLWTILSTLWTIWAASWFRSCPMILKVQCVRFGLICEFYIGKSSVRCPCVHE